MLTAVTARAPRWACAVVILILIGIAALPADATMPFAYEWKAPRVHVYWREGNRGARDGALRAQLGHWKRVAATLWQAKQAPPLKLTASFYGTGVGSGEPLLVAEAGGRKAVVQPPFSEERVLAALYAVRDGRPGPSQDIHPPDDAAPRVSPDGKWISFLSWRSGSPEAWVASRDGEQVFRFPFAGTDGDVLTQLVFRSPEWSPTGSQLAWVQGGRLVLADLSAQTAALVTPADKTVAGFHWSPGPGHPLVVTYDDEGFDIVDPPSQRAIPISTLLTDAAGVGSYSWSPSGRHLLFRAQTRVTGKDLRTPRGVIAWLQQGLDRLLGRAQPDEEQVGNYTERLVALNLETQRLTSIPLENTPLAEGELTGAAWNRAEDRVFMVVDQSAKHTIVGLSLPSPGGGVTTVYTADERVVAVGARLADPEPATGRAVEPPLVFLQDGKRLLLDVAQGKLTPDAAAEGVQDVRLQAGPQGGYSGVELDEITDDEPSARVFLKNEPQLTPFRHALPRGVYAAVPLPSPAFANIQELVVRTAVVDGDVRPLPEGGVATALVSAQGGVGEIHVERQDTSGSAALNLSERIAAVKPVEVAVRDEVYPATDPRASLGSLAARFHPVSPTRTVVLIAAVILACLALVGYRRWRQRHPRKPRPSAARGGQPLEDSGS